MNTHMRDIRHAVRTLSKAPGTVFVVGLIAVSVGITTAIFSLVDATLLRPNAYADPNELVFLWGTPRLDIRRGLSSVEIEEWRTDGSAFEDVVPFFGGKEFNTETLVAIGADDTKKVPAAYISPRLFSILGSAPLLGRNFLNTEDEPDRNKVVILSHGLWMSRFGGEREILNRAISLDGEPHIVVGIMPAGFYFPDFRAKLWVPLPRDFMGMDQRDAMVVHALGRLKPGVSARQVRTEIQTIADRTARKDSDRVQARQPGIFPFLSVLMGQAEGGLWALLGTVLLIQLLACANVAHLLLARMFERRQEFAIRAALGASRSRILGQLLSESILLAAVAGVLGIILAQWGLQILMMVALEEAPWMEAASLNGRVLGFSLALSLLTGLLFGLAPALQSMRLNLSGALRPGGAPPTQRGRGRGRTPRDLLVTGQVSLAVVLMIGTVLLANSFVRLMQFDWGFDPKNSVVFILELPEAKYGQYMRNRLPSEALQKRAPVFAFLEAARRNIEQLPGIKAVGWSNSVPIRWGGRHSGAIMKDQQPREAPWTTVWPVGPGYFESVGIPLLRGQGFSAETDPGKLPEVVISEKVAQLVWGDANPVGEQVDLALWIRPAPNPERTPPTLQWWPHRVVGVAGNVRMFTMQIAVGNDIYFDLRREPHAPFGHPKLVVRTEGDPLDQVELLKQQIVRAERDVEFSAIVTLESLVEEKGGSRNAHVLVSIVSTVFGLMALLLAVAGLYGLVSYTASQRTREFGIRLALGAQRRDIYKLVMGTVLRLTGSGLALGLVGAWALTRLLEGLLFGVTATDPLTFAAVAGLLLLVALLACWVPARRAMRVDPMEALRYE